MPGKLLASAAEDSIVRIWDVKSRSTIRELTGHTGAIYSLAFHPDGVVLATGAGTEIPTDEVDRSIRVWSKYSNARRGSHLPLRPFHH